MPVTREGPHLHDLSIPSRTLTQSTVSRDRLLWRPGWEPPRRPPCIWSRSMRDLERIVQSLPSNRRSFSRHGHINQVLRRMSTESPVIDTCRRGARTRGPCAVPPCCPGLARCARAGAPQSLPSAQAIPRCTARDGPTHHGVRPAGIEPAACGSKDRRRMAEAPRFERVSGPEHGFLAGDSAGLVPKAVPTEEGGTHAVPTM